MFHDLKQHATNFAAKRGYGKSPSDEGGYLNATFFCQWDGIKAWFSKGFQAAFLGNFEGTSFLRLPQLERRGADNFKYRSSRPPDERVAP